MRQTVAKRIKREIYGDMTTGIEGRKHFINRSTGEVVADPKRQQYQNAKKAHVAGIR